MNSNQQDMPNSTRRLRMGQWMAVGTAVCVLSACSNSMYIGNRNGSKQARDAVEVRISAAVQTGMGVVVMTTPNLDSIGGWDFSRADDMVTFNMLRDSGMQWQNLDIPGQYFNAGPGHLYWHTKKEHSAHLQLVDGRTAYQVFIVAPGRYGLKASETVRPRSPLPVLSPQAKLKSGGLGKVLIAQIEATEYHQEPQWSNDRYSTKTATQSYCSLVHTASGACVQYSDYAYEYSSLDRAAGWYLATQSKQVPNLRLRVGLDQPFATFKVNPSEIVLVDGFYAENQNVGFNPNDCSASAGDEITCRVNRFTAVRMGTSLADFARTTPLAELGYPKAAEAFKNMRYEALQVHAQASNQNSRWGRVYEQRSR
ncbi:hypothetical protein LVJ82_00235 [Vitreoscilla massiliensis]|uniref:Lipoprotein n=1 Tax=Vitreoscilla massiliensis TaxID=1689272 RepID=A0ABY4E290_9NEIS|nr:hypothetical protein [Vitreoscilla massiliensis]UOO89443.1 hypothetical protein LVJ82_00235 [Vitreoscilla massiliensis]